MTWKNEIKRIGDELRARSGHDREYWCTDPNNEDRIQLNPYLNCSYDHFIIREINEPFTNRKILLVNQKRPGTIWHPKFRVWNSGNFPSETCYVEVRETPGNILKEKTIITLQPGETRDVTLEVLVGEPGTTLVGVCYDPILDPYDSTDTTGRKTTTLALAMLETTIPRFIGPSPG